MTCLTYTDVCGLGRPLASPYTHGHSYKGNPGIRCQASTKAVDTKHLFVFGLGYTGRGLANSLRQSGWIVSGTCRQPEQQQLLVTQGVDAICTGEQMSQQSRSQIVLGLQHATHILCTIPPSTQDSLAAELVLAHAASSLQWIGYLSSTSVYGDWGGRWVDERSLLGISPRKDFVASLQLRAQAGNQQIHSES
ncbi:hypothetical protein ABBQ38_004879 [Trebouxia sp. C0009 RCD-2024]